MFSNKPYLVRAFYEWIVDNDCTPYIVINASYPRCNVPTEHIENGEITLNVSPSAIRDLKITNDTVDFRASFSGVVHIINAPVKAILAIYAQENQQGMFFDYEETEDFESEEVDLIAQNKSNDTVNDKITNKGRSHLKLVEDIVE
ncbi:ClpXP protease specificity-enhancing factor [Gammaproteobacteria bacterium]|nr:ClpXP protease specificity-enhancing factor [Gammaproteobacteria bacterium]